MKRLRSFVYAAALACAFASPAMANPGTAFTWQGRLTNNGTPINGTVDLRFRLFNAATGGSSVGAILTLTNVQVVNGLASVELDFGNQFNGDPRWLQISIDGNGGADSFTLLSPRRALRPIPYAITSSNTLSGGGPGDLHSLNAADNDPIDVVYVTNDANVGIGTTTALAPLHVAAVMDLGVSDLTIQSTTVQGEGGFNQMGYPYSVDVVGNLGAITSIDHDAVTFFNPADPTNPVFISSMENGGSDSVGTPINNMNFLINVCLGGGMAYILSAEGAITAVDVSNPALPVIESVIVDGGIDSVGNPISLLAAGFEIILDDTILYASNATQKSVLIFDYSDPSSPVLLRTMVAGGTDAVGNPLTDVDRPGRMFVWEEELFVLDVTSYAVNIFDVSDPANPILEFTIKDGGTDGAGTPIDDLEDPFSVACDNDVLYVAAREDVLAFDISVPANPILLSVMADGEVDSNGVAADRLRFGSVVAANSILYVASTADTAVTLLDYSDPQDPVVLREIHQGGLDGAGMPVEHLTGVSDLAIRGTSLYLANSATNCFWVLGYSAPEASMMVDGTSYFNDRIVVSGIASIDEGLVVAGSTSLNGGLSLNSPADFNQDVAMNENELRLRSLSDPNHGLGWFGTDQGGTPFAGVDVNGPVLFGFDGGALGKRTGFGTESIALRWLHDRVGIGTNSPARRLDVHSPVTGIARFESSSVDGSWLELENTSSGGAAWNLISTGSNNGEGAGNLVAYNNGAKAIIKSDGKLEVAGNIRANNFVEGSGELHLTGNGSGGADMTFDSNGRIGVQSGPISNVRFLIDGVTGDANLLQVRNNSDITRFLVQNDGRSGFNNVYADMALNVRGNVGDSQLLRVEDSTGAPQLQVNSNTVSLESNELRLVSGSDGNHGLAFKGPGAANFAGMSVDGPALWGFAGGLLGTKQTGTETAVLRWTNTGVGINMGTANPAVPLEVQGTSDTVVRARSNWTGGSWLDLINTSVGGNSWSLISSGSGNGEGAGHLIAFMSGAKAIIKSNGNVGIGNTNPQDKLQVEGNVRVNNSIMGSGNLNLSGDTVGGPDVIINANGRTGVGSAPIGNTRLSVRGVSGDTDLFRVKSIGDADRLQIGEDGRHGFNAKYGNISLNVRGVSGDAAYFRVEDSAAEAHLIVSDTLVNVNSANFTVTNGAKLFTIDHPQDPANKDLRHNTIEGPGYYTFYKGNVVLNEKGEAWAELPSYCESLNTNWNYQLTAVGAAMPNLHVAQTVKDNRFKISGGAAGKQVSWQVTADRNDPYAQDHPFEAEVPKDEAEQGHYHYPEGYGKSAELAVGRIKMSEAARQDSADQ